METVEVTLMPPFHLLVERAVYEFPAHPGMTVRDVCAAVSAQLSPLRPFLPAGQYAHYLVILRTGDHEYRQLRLDDPVSAGDRLAFWAPSFGG